MILFLIFRCPEHRVKKTNPGLALLMADLESQEEEDQEDVNTDTSDEGLSQPDFVLSGEGQKKQNVSSIPNNHNANKVATPGNKTTPGNESTPGNRNAPLNWKTPLKRKTPEQRTTTKNDRTTPGNETNPGNETATGIETLPGNKTIPGPGNKTIPGPGNKTTHGPGNKTSRRIINSEPKKKPPQVTTKLAKKLKLFNDFDNLT